MHIALAKFTSYSSSTGLVEMVSFNVSIVLSCSCCHWNVTSSSSRLESGGMMEGSLGMK